MRVLQFKNNSILYKTKKMFISILTVTFLAQSITADTIKDSGDLLFVALPVIAYGATFYYHDKEGREQFYKLFATNAVAVYGLKYLINRKRPNGEDYSFPSGHAAVTFASAAFIDRRYGFDKAFGIYLAAAFTGYSRVESDMHYVSDVLAGSIIGMISSYYFTTKYRGFTVSPLISKKTFGFTIGKQW